MNDLVIRGGWIVDGTGGTRRRGDLGIAEGRVVEALEPGTAMGRSYLEADGLIVAPGFVDIHTHYDAQLTWDPAAVPSSLHGVTTVIGGNCGFSLSPIDDSSADYLVPMLAKVEGIPEDALKEGLSVSWSDFGSFLDVLEQKLAVNAGFMVGHSAIRRTVMGESAVGGRADEKELATMVQMVHQSIEAGALGFSTSRGEAHLDHNGDPVPSRHASVAEVLALCHAAGQHAGTSIEAIPTLDQVFDREAQMFLVSLSLAAGRPVNWNLLTIEQGPAALESRLDASLSARAAGGKVVGLTPCQPSVSRNSLENAFLWESIPGWAPTMHLPLAARIEAFRDSAVRDDLRKGATQITRRWVDWPGYRVNDASAPGLASVVGRRVGDIAAERGADPFDVFCDIAVEGDLRVGWSMPTFDNEDGWMRLVRLCQNPNVVVGGSDAGAHVNMSSAFAMYTGFLAGAVREHGLLRLEDAIALITSAPARLYGLLGRGTLLPGDAADIVIFDESTIGHGPVEMRNDLPGGAERLYCAPKGIHEVLVGGSAIVRNGAVTGATPGQIMRSGRDTQSPVMT
jgi:N-acyl-D-aspartate/D-glutamate deacylase